MKLEPGDAAALARLLGEPGVECFVLPRVAPALLVVTGAKHSGLFLLGARGVDVLERLLDAGGSRSSVTRFCRLAGYRIGVGEVAELVGLAERLDCASAVAS